jgi:hypothetical protein
LREIQPEHAWTENKSSTGIEYCGDPSRHPSSDERRQTGQRNYSSSMHASAQTLFQKSQLTLIENYLGD